jgi:hypothetical protein
MPFKIIQLPKQDKLCKTLSLPILERMYDRQTVEELITVFHHKPTRARKLTMIVVVYVLICWTLFLGSTLGAVYAELCSSERYLAEQDPEELEGTRSLGVSTQTGWSPDPSPSLRAQVQAFGSAPDARGICLWSASDGY